MYPWALSGCTVIGLQLRQNKQTKIRGAWNLLSGLPSAQAWEVPTGWLCVGFQGLTCS